MRFVVLQFLLTALVATCLAVEVYLYATTGSALSLGGMVFCGIMTVVCLFNLFRTSSY